MTNALSALDAHHRLIIAALSGIILLFLFACLFHDILPICHFVFGCDHAMH